MSAYDFIVLGGGSAGYAAARTATDLGLKVAVVEGGKEVGGLCILRGCMPSKTLIESANRYRTLERASEFGLRAGQIGFNAAEIIARKRKLIGEFADYRCEQLESGRFTFVRGEASFLDANTISVRNVDGSDTKLTAKSFLIATGSSISTPDIPGLQETGYLTSDDILELEHLPKSITVLGAGPVALELAHYLSSLGTKVTILQRSAHLLKGTDPEMAKVVEKTFLTRGMKIHTNTRLLRIEKHGDLKRVIFEQEGQEYSSDTDEIFVALGRKPNIAKLNLKAADVKIEKDKVLTHSTQQTSAKNIFAAGDVCGPYEIVHIAIQQGEIAALNAARVIQKSKGELETSDYRLKIYVVFTDPEVAVVGLSESECTEKNIPHVSASYPFNDHGKSLVMGEPDGFVKLVAHAKTGEILGGGVVGPHASDLIHEIVVAMAFHATAAQFAVIPHYHPTLSEIWTYPAEEICGQITPHNP
ncbi:MAG: NAD(P)/FAD-dependent oxidoreductase [Chthoniobacterales bacterium]